MAYIVTGLCDTGELTFVLASDSMPANEELKRLAERHGYTQMLVVNAATRLAAARFGFALEAVLRPLPLGRR